MTTGHTDSQESTETGAAKTARQGVAIVGFVLIAIIGMTIAVYAARFVPSALSGMASATAYVSSLFVPPADEEPSPEAPVLVPVEPETPVVITPATTTLATPTAPVTTPSKPVAPATPTYYGSADLTVNFTAFGYCAGRTFVNASRIPNGADYGAQFTLTNEGTNIASGWRYMVETPDGSDVEGAGVTLLPSRSAIGTTCFSIEDGGGELSITVDSRNAVRESNERNNTDSENFGNSSNNNNDDLSCDIEASDRTIDEGDTITLRWETDGDVDDARINQGVGSVDEDGGSKHVSPRFDTTYRLTIEDNDGNEETCSVSIEVDEN